MKYVESAEYLACVECHFKSLREPAEQAVRVAVEINNLIGAYVYGSVARKILDKNKNRRKLFGPESDADIMFYLSEKAAADREISEKFYRDFRRKLPLDNTVDVAVIDTFPDPFGIKVMWIYDVVGNRENIPLYEFGQFSFPKNW